MKKCIMIDPRVKQIRNILDTLARAERQDNDIKEVVYDEELLKVRKIDRNEIIDIVREAIGTNDKRKRFAPFVFSELTDVPGIETVFEDLLESADDSGRSQIIQTIGLRKMRTLVGVLNRHFYKESDEFCKDMTLHSVGAIADETSLPLFVELMQRDDHLYEWRILSASHRFVRPEFAGYLENVFRHPSSKNSHKVMAAWGLAKLGDEAAYEYLVSMLDDPETRTLTSIDPGESIRAAQAVADVNLWDFKWGKSSVELVKARAKAISQPQI